MTDEVPERAALRLAGFALAHAIWSIEDGESLCTLSLLERAGGERELGRYEAPTIPDSLEGAFADLEARLARDDRAVVVFDGYITLPGGERTDALIADVFGAGMRHIGRLVQRYRPATRSPRRFSEPWGFALVGPPEAGDSFGPAADPLVLAGALEHENAAHHFRF